MQLFYLENLTKECHLSKEESTHCIIVLRKKINDKIFITDGKGTIYSTYIININKNIVQIGELKELYSNKDKFSKVLYTYYQQANINESYADYLKDIFPNPVLVNNDCLDKPSQKDTPPPSPVTQKKFLTGRVVFF